MTLTEEINKIFPLIISTPNFVCRVHEDNQSCIKMDTGSKFSPITKHIALKYHHFRSHIKYGRVEINFRPTNEQLADLLTKPLSNEAFFVLRYMLCGWGYGSKTWTFWFYWYSPFQHNGIFYTSFFCGVIFPSTIVTNCRSQVRWIHLHEGVWEYTRFGSMNLGR